MSTKVLTNFDMNGNQIKNLVLDTVTSDPVTPLEGQLWYNTTTNLAKYYDGASTVTISAGAGSTAYSASIPFTDGDTLRRVSVSNGVVTATSKIVGTIRRPDTASDSVDRGYIYHANVVLVGTGSFDLLVVCTGWGFDEVTDLPPNETITFYYQVF
jgi:hypothetical protein